MRAIWNVNAGRKAGIPMGSFNEPEMRALMERHGLGTELVSTHSEDEAVAAVRSALRAGDGTIVAAGGDGTIGLVARQLLGSDTALGMLPLGSVMNIPRMLGLPRDLDEAAALLGDPATPRRRIDVGEVNGQTFFEGGSVGYHAAVFQDMADVDRGDYLALARAVVTAFRYRPSRMSVELDDGRQLATRALVVAVTIGPYLGAGFTVAPEAKVDDGLFDVRVFEHYSKLELVRHFVSIAFGRRAYAPHVVSVRAPRVRITSASDLPARADAEPLGSTPVEFLIRPGVLLVVAPHPAPAAPVPVSHG